MNIITAEQAKNISKNNITNIFNKEIKCIMNKVKKSSQLGYFKATIILESKEDLYWWTKNEKPKKESIHKRFNNINLKKYMESIGYKYEVYSDSSNGYYYSYINISW